MTGFIREHLIKRFTRSSKWPKVRKEHLKEQPFCVICGRKWNLQVHHIEPFHLKPELELDPKNLVTFCGRCHLLFGHLNNWKRYNPSYYLIDDIKIWKNKIHPPS